MKRLFILWIILLTTATAHGQMYGIYEGYGPDPFYCGSMKTWHWKNEIIHDTAFLRVKYRMSFLNHTRERLYYDDRIVEIGKSGVKKDYSERLAFYLDKIDSIDYVSFFFYPATWFINSQKSWTIYQTIWAGPKLQYEEKPVHFEWTLLPETDTLLGYSCQKATTNFKGRNYEAWYCPDIPVSSGPYKFSGLPGLILKIQDSLQEYTWEATGIENGNWPLSEKKFITQKCSKKQAHNTLSNMYAHPFLFATTIEGASISIMVESADGLLSRDPGEAEFSMSYFYNPIELTD